MSRRSVTDSVDQLAVTAAAGGEPPFRVDFDAVEFQHDPWPAYDWHREHAPVTWVPALQSYAVFGHRHVREALTSASFSVDHPFRTSRRAFGASMLDQEGPAHTGPRSAVTAVLRPREVHALAERVVLPLLDEILGQTVRKGADDITDLLATRLPMAVTCRLLGLPVEDAAWLQSAMRPLVDYVDQQAVPLATVVAHRRSLRQYLEGRINTGGGNDHLLALLAADSATSGADLANNAILLLAAGTETTTAAITTLVRRVVLEPGLWQSLAADRTLVPAVVREVLRHEPPLHFTLRFAVGDISLGGVDLPHGSAVQVCLASANRDPRSFPGADVFDPGRDQRAPLSFGSGRHICVGMGFAVAELELALGALLDRIDDVAVVGQVPAVRGRTFRHAMGLRLSYSARGTAHE